MNRTVARVVAEPGAAPSDLEVEVPDPTGHQVLVRIHAVGVCHTDLTLAANWPEQGMPVILGHEGAGVVEAVGPDVTTVRAGDRVSLTFDSCGACEFCAAGTPACWGIPGKGRPTGDSPPCVIPPAGGWVC